MCAVYGKAMPSYAVVKHCVYEFKSGKGYLKSDPRSGQPLSATSGENIEKVHELVI